MEPSDDNLYESSYCGAEYTNAASTNTRVTIKQQPSPKTKKGSKKRLIRIGGGLLVIIFMTVVVMLFLMIHYQLENLQCASESTNSAQREPGKEPPTTESRSCMDLRNKGVTASGVHQIKTDSNSLPIQVYCDMETNGGGWTLVASIHESDINEKCFSDDLWSGYVPTSAGYIHGKTNWENEMIFGDVHLCRQYDYKSSAYHKLNASDVMVWHVPAGMQIDNMRRQSTFRYRTTNKFLEQYGGNLLDLFKNYFPLSVNNTDIDPYVANAVLEVISKKFPEIMQVIPNFYRYRLTSTYYTRDSKIYSSSSSSSSNVIRFYGSQNSYSNLVYGAEYKDTSSLTSIISSTATAAVPFTVISTIKNADRLSNYYYIRVDSYLHSSGSSKTEFENTTTLGNFKLHYHAIQFYQGSTSWNVECRFHFYISNLKEWNSVEPSKFYQSYMSESGTHKMVDYKIEGKPSRIVFGYMLLSRDGGDKITSDHLNRVAAVILKSISEIPNVMKEPSAKNTLVVPITFDKGSAKEIIAVNPPEMWPSIQAGNIQFRSYNLSGYPNAFCPGISVNSPSPEHVCVGGISGDISTYGTCGDFAGWHGKSTDSLSPSRPVGYAHSSKDILSTLLLFYR